MIEAHLKKLAEDKIIEALLLAEKYFGRTFEIPAIEWEDMGRKAGLAFCRSNRVVYSPTLFRENQDEFLSRTVPHEIAHLVTYRVYPLAKQMHGPEFRSVCRVLGMTDVSTHHSYDTSSVAKKTKRHTWRCKCREHQISTRIHNEMRRGYLRKCLKCGEVLTRVVSFGVDYFSKGVVRSVI